MKYISIQLVSLFLISAFLISCKVEPKPIEYGIDVCNYCKMNIVEKTHSAQYVTKKGKQFKFDAVECLVHAMQETDVSKIQLFLVADFSNPGVMINAQEATFLISPGIKSPMGADLTAVSMRSFGEELKKEHKGDLYTWVELQNKMKTN